MSETRVLIIRAKALSEDPVEEMVKTKKDYQVSVTHTGRDALDYLQREPVDVVVLDADSLRRSGEGIIRRIRQRFATLPIVLIRGSGQSESVDGASLVLARPFSARRLLNVLGGFRSDREGEILQVGDLVLHVDRRSLVRGERWYRLTPKQTQLLQAFMRRPGDVLSRRFLMKAVWDTDYLGDTRTLEVHIRWLRICVEKDPDHPVRLTTVRGIGYRLDLGEQPDRQNGYHVAEET